MGADLILNVVATRRAEADLDWDAGAEVIKTLVLGEDTHADLFHLYAEGETPEEHVESVRESLIARVEELRDAIVHGDPTLSSVAFGEWTIYNIGGTSWGDSPSDVFDAVHDLDTAGPSVLEAIGFDWPDRSDA